MIAYVESNFVLEIALGQDQAAEAEAILRLAESGAIELAFPSIAVTEPFSTITYRHLQRRRLGKELTDQIKHLRRSAPHGATVLALQPMLPLLEAVGDREARLVASVVARMLALGQAIPVDAAGFSRARTYQDSYGLSPQDALVFAGVISDLPRREPVERKCFVSRNWRDFDFADARNELQAYNCRYINSFKDALQFIRSAAERD